MWSGELIGAFELSSRLDGDTYKSFLEDNLPILLEDVNLERRTMVFQNDGAPCHYATQQRWEEIKGTRKFSNNVVILKKLFRYKEVMRSSQMFIVLCLVVVMVTATQDGRRTLIQSPTTTTEHWEEVNIVKCDEKINNFCGSIADPLDSKPGSHYLGGNSHGW
ncbi:hypothetical protein evm_008682 [Chilo suppressalis]|nr:hypothetical protein evm_008682 [Chilo suppressalis]